MKLDYTTFEMVLPSELTEIDLNAMGPDDYCVCVVDTLYPHGLECRQCGCPVKPIDN